MRMEHLWNDVYKGKQKHSNKPATVLFWPSWIPKGLTLTGSRAIAVRSR